MNDWKERLKAEYTELKERLEKLHRWNVKQEAAWRLRVYGCERVEDELNRGLCRDQEEAMERYLHILELRAEINGMELGKDGDKK